jgi:glucosyl-3-phosphoglycerate synthase
MEYVQERITTLHELTDATPDAPTGRTAVVVPMAGREYRTPAAEHVLSTLAAVEPATVIIALRAPPEKIGGFREWLVSFDLAVEVCWCGGPRLESLLADHGLAGEGGKGRDVWLALGLASQHDYIVVHDADATSYTASHVPKLCAPLADHSDGFDFVKGYYARVERNQLFGRLFRLFYAPLVAALHNSHDAEILDFLGAFRYALAGEFGLTGDLARQVRVSRGWGLEIDTLGAAFDAAGFAGTAQVDLGNDVHDHRGVSGSGGLAAMSREVGQALLRTVEAHGVTPEYGTLSARYEQVAARFVRQYAADAAHNGLDYDADAEREQVERYAEAIAPPGEDTRLPAWKDAPLDPSEVREAVQADLAAEN